jgi:hypothetical protein
MITTQAFRGSATVTPPTKPKIYSVSLPTANTEVAQLLSNGTKKLRIKALGNSRVQYAWNATESGTGPFWTIPRGGVEPIDGINYTGSIYLQASESGETVQIEEWT